MPSCHRLVALRCARSPTTGLMDCCAYTFSHRLRLLRGLYSPVPSSRNYYILALFPRFWGVAKHALCHRRLDGLLHIHPTTTGSKCCSARILLPPVRRAVTSSPLRCRFINMLCTHTPATVSEIHDAVILLIQARGVVMDTQPFHMRGWLFHSICRLQRPIQFSRHLQMLRKVGNLPCLLLTILLSTALLLSFYYSSVVFLSRILLT